MTKLLPAAGLLGFSVVVLGAFGAHGLEWRLSDAGTDWWETATLYGLVHAVACLAVALHGQARSGLKIAGWAFFVGVLLFSGSLYAMALGAPTSLGMVTPLGGLGFLAGWAMLVIQGLQRG